VGFMGVGFKSIFKVFQRVAVHTRAGLHFELDASDDLSGSTLPKIIDLVNDGINAKFADSSTSLPALETVFELTSPTVGIDDVLRYTKLVPPRTSLHDACLTLGAANKESIDASLLAFFAVLSVRGLEHLKLNDIVLKFVVNRAAHQVTMTLSSSRALKPVQFFEALLDKSAHWASFCRMRRGHLNTQAVPPETPMYVRAFFTPGGSGGRKYWLTALLPTSVESPFAFHIDAPWLVDIDRYELKKVVGICCCLTTALCRQGLRTDPNRGREWNANIWHHVPSLVAQYATWLCSSRNHLDGAALCLTTMYRDKFVRHVEAYVDRDDFRLCLIRAIKTVKLIPVWSDTDDGAIAWTSFTERGVVPCLSRDAVAWLRGIPSRHLLLRGTVASVVFDHETVQFLTWMEFFSAESTVDELKKCWLEGISQWLPAERDLRMQWWPMLFKNLPFEFQKALALMPLEKQGVLHWHSISSLFLCPNDDGGAFSSFFSPIIPVIADWAWESGHDGAIWCKSELSLRTLANLCASPGVLTWLTKAIAHCAKLSIDTSPALLVRFQRVVLENCSLSLAVTLLASTWMVTTAAADDDKVIFAPIAHV
jgi:hypothetical protein